MDIATAIDWASQRTVGTLITIRRDGRPQSSDVAYWIKHGTVVVSLTESRAKTRNIAADPRVVLHISEPSKMSYVSLDGVASLSATTTRPDDDTSDALVEYFEGVSGKPHPDWAEYRQAMIEEQRLLATITIGSAVGWLH
jgi:PPOX class probable F420-dependent enzyme